MDSLPVAGQKRKRQRVIAEVDPISKLVGKLHHYQKEVRKAAKKAKAFETQRLVKKLKGLRQKEKNGSNDATKDLEMQMEVLKKFDPDIISRRALSTKIRKDGLLSHNEAMKAALAASSLSSTHLPEHKDVSYEKVSSRLLSSKILASGVQDAVNHLKIAVDPSLRPKGRHVSSESEEEHTVDGVSSAGEDDGEEVGEEDLGGKDRILDEANDFVDETGWESGSVNDDDGGDSDEQEPEDYDSEYESGDDEDQEMEDASEYEVPEPPRKKVKDQKPSKSKGAASSASGATSTFLPSLSMGYINGDSDSVISDGEASDTVKRKNRRGQRARQAIWEKKYGKNAKHVESRQKELQAKLTAKNLGKRQDAGWKGRRGTAGGAQPQKPFKPGQAVDDKPAHPSWEAKKKLKEREGRILPPQGKKIVFK